MFSKYLKRTGGLSVAESGDRVRELGFDHLDLTVRPGGHVEPDEAPERLPGVVETLREKGVGVPLITTSITGADEEHAESLFRLADECGIEHLKLGYWRYDGFGTVADGLVAMREDLAGIRELSADYDVTPSVHTHSGDFLSANPAFLRESLVDGDPEDLGIYVDPGHLVVEGGKSGWEMNLDLVSDYVQMVSVKDFGWFSEETDAGVEWEPRTVPLGEGMVPWATVFDRLREAGFDGPVSVHSEYPDLSTGELLDRTAGDLAYLREVALR